ncbi:hypothetical protein PoB_005854600 [Plakobranchus ocellatus]|uniref:Uncharacterized protein n=1 Tax=Plakobranchus ocellatus TaxID=259542 RepID=A0AAV4CKF8_9GAST|nr:hypothetical protein PoB_005854600 [Plakobranchus ocellatus]
MVTELLGEYDLFWRFTSFSQSCSMLLLAVYKDEEHLRDHRFESEEDIIFATKEAIRELDKDFYVTTFDSSLWMMQKCINNDGRLRWIEHRMKVIDAKNHDSKPLSS